MEGALNDYETSRAQIPVLLISSNSNVTTQMRHALKSVGFGVISCAPSHSLGIDKFRDRPFPVVIFDAKKTDMPTEAFVMQMAKLDPDAALIPFSGEPQVDDIFGLLRAGARHFISVPFNAETVELVILRAAEGPALSEVVLQSTDRNSALAGVVLNCLYRVTVLQRQVRECPRWKSILEREQRYLAETSELAKTFCEGGEQALQEKIVEGCLKRSELSATRIGRARARLRTQREKKKVGKSTQDRLALAAVDMLKRVN